MNTHLVLVPSLGALTARGLAGDDVQGLGGQTDGALDLQRLGDGTLLQLLAHLLEGGDLAGGQGDTDLVDLLLVGVWLALIRFGLCYIGGRDGSLVAGIFCVQQPLAPISGDGAN